MLSALGKRLANVHLGFKIGDSLKPNPNIEREAVVPEFWIGKTSNVPVLNNHCHTSEIEIAMTQNFSHPCPRPASAADLPSEFAGEWLTPKNTRYIINTAGYLEDHIEPSEYQARITSDDKLCATTGGEEICYGRTSGEVGEVLGTWNDQGEVFDFQPGGKLKTKAASYTQLLSGKYTASTPDSSGNFDLETWTVVGSMWIEDEMLHWLELKKDDECSEREYEYEFCLLYTSPSPRDATLSRMPSSA